MAFTAGDSFISKQQITDIVVDTLTFDGDELLDGVSIATTPGGSIKLASGNDFSTSEKYNVSFDLVSVSDADASTLLTSIMGLEKTVVITLINGITHTFPAIINVLKSAVANDLCSYKINMEVEDFNIDEIVTVA